MDQTKDHSNFMDREQEMERTEPDFELTNDEWQVEGTMGRRRYCQVDYSTSDRVIRRYRKDYASWRKGNPRGAKGEVSEVVHAAETGVPTPAKRQSVAQSPTLREVAGSSHTFGFVNALLNCLNYSIGVSLFAVPYFLSRLGWIAILIILVASILTWSTARALGFMLEKTEANSYAEISYSACGPKFGSTVAAVIRGFQVLELFSYFAYGNVALYSLFEDSVKQPSLTKYEIYFILCLITIPMIFMRSRKVMILSSKIGFSCLICAVLIILQDCLHGKTSILAPAPTELFQGGLYDFFEVSGSILLLFSGHAALPSIYIGLENKKDFNAVVDYTFLIFVPAILILGSFGYICYGKSTNPIVAINIEGRIAHFLGMLLLSLKLYTSNYFILTPLVREFEHAFAGIFLQPPAVEFLSIDDDIEAPLLSAETLPDIALDQGRDYSKSFYENPVFDLFTFAEEKQKPLGIYTDPITRANLHQDARLRLGQLLDKETLKTLQRMERSPILKALVRRDTHVKIEENEIPVRTEEKAFRLEILIRGCVVIAGLLFACFMPNIQFVMSMIGAIFAVNIALTFPAALYFSLGSGKLSKFFAVILGFMGVYVMITSVYASMLQL